MIKEFFESSSVEEPKTKDVTESVPLEEKKSKDVTISYSQYSEWSKCPYSWKLNYIDKLKKRENSIHTAFGTGIHKAIQTYLKCLYDESAVEADQLNLFEIFKTEFYLNLRNKDDEGNIIEEGWIGSTNSEEVDEFLSDGRNILTFFTEPSNRSKHFPSKRYEVLGVELPLEFKLKPKLLYKGFIDLVLRDKITKKIIIYDFKTSTQGWNKYQKADELKLNQLLLYKKFYAKLFKVEEKNISVEFFIVKRKLFENVDWQQSRIQKLVPPSGKQSLNSALESFMYFVKNSFDDIGHHNKSIKYPKNPGKAKKNCKYCSFYKTDKCDSKED